MKRKREEVQCPVCGSILKSRASLYGHMSFMRRKRDQAHIGYQSALNQHQCPVCDFRGKRKSDVGGHIQNYVRRNSEAAHTTFYNQQVKLVQELFEQNKTIIEIAQHKYVFFSQAWISEKIKSLKGQEMCKVCSKKYRDVQGLKSHVSKQKDADHREYFQEIGPNEWHKKYAIKKICPVPGCGHYSNWVNRHIRMKVKQDDQAHVDYYNKYEFVCPVCDKKLKSQAGLSGHIRNLSRSNQQHQDFLSEQEQKINHLTVMVGKRQWKSAGRTI